MHPLVSAPSMHGLSHIQRYILQRCLSGRLEPGCYHTQFSYHLQIAGLALPLFFKALAQIVERHPVLRTRFASAPDGGIRQRIDAAPAPHIRFDDISTQPPAAQQQWLQALLLADRSRPFILVDGAEPLVRVHLVKRAADALQLILVIHHAIWDGWSLAVLMKEILGQYRRLKHNPTSKLAPAAYDYADFIEDEAAAGGAAEAARLWAQHLRRHDSGAALPPARPGDGPDYAPVEARLPATLVKQLEQHARQQKLPLRTMFVAATALLARETYPGAQPTTTIGIVSNGRSIRLRKPLETLGLLWNLAPLCVDMVAGAPAEGAALFPALLQRVQHGLNETAPITSYPLLDLLRDGGDDELFRVSFNYIDFGGANILSKDAGIAFLETGGFDKFHYPLNVLVGRSPFDRGITVVLNYDSRLLARTRVEAILRRFIGLLTTVGGVATGNALYA